MEEDLKELQIIIDTERKILCEDIKPNDEEVYTLDGRQFIALENLIKGYRELEEENRIFALAGSNIALKLHIEKNYISKSKIKEKIEEVNKSLGYSPVNKILIEQVLQELMEDK